MASGSPAGTRAAVAWRQQLNWGLSTQLLKRLRSSPAVRHRVFPTGCGRSVACGLISRSLTSCGLLLVSSRHAAGRAIPPMLVEPTGVPASFGLGRIGSSGAASGWLRWHADWHFHCTIKSRLSTAETVDHGWPGLIWAVASHLLLTCKYRCTSCKSATRCYTQQCSN